MAYKLELDEDVRTGIRRSAQEQLDRAIRELSERIADDPVDAVHTARKAVKKERSLLRLARGTMPAGQRRRENAALRDAARGLSTARDAEVMLATLDDLSHRYVGQLPETTFDEVRAELERLRDAQRSQLVGSALGSRAVQELGDVRLRAEGWELKRGGWRALEPGLARAYRDGRRAFARARARRSAAALHAARKRVKDLWYQERLLAPAAGPAVAGHGKDAHRLSDLLGDDHDLAVLRQALTTGRVRAAADIDAIVALIDHRRDELQQEIMSLGERVYAEPPRAFLKRTRRAWKAGRRGAKAQRREDPRELAAATRVPHPG
jgi:CHAD domain-containing protein